MLRKRGDAVSSPSGLQRVVLARATQGVTPLIFTAIALPGTLVAGLSMGLAGAFLAVICLASGCHSDLMAALRTRSVWMVATASAFAAACGASAPVYIDVASTVFLASLAPVFGAAMAPLFGEKVGRATWIAVLVGVVGALLVGLPQINDDTSLFGVFLALGIAAGGALVIHGMRRSAVSGGGLGFVAVVMLLGSAPLLLLQLGTLSAITPSRALLIFLAAVVFVLLNLLLISGLKSTTATTAILLGGVNILVGTAGGFLLFNQIPSLLAVIGVLVIAFSAWLAAKASRAARQMAAAALVSEKA